MATSEKTKDMIEVGVADTSKKRGTLTIKDRIYIEAHYEADSVAAIASVLRRTPATVQKYIEQMLPNKPIQTEMEPEAELRLTLQASFKHTPEWLALKKEFGPDEIQYFEHRYAKLLSQFKDDITPTEETQIFSLIKFEILGQRVLAHRQKAEGDIKRKGKALAKLYEDCGNDLTRLTPDNQQFVANMEHDIANIRAFQHSSNKEYADLQSEVNTIMKALKGTRDQRIDKIQSNKVTFVEVIKGIMEDTVREREGRQMELMRKAAEKELKRLSAPHTYDDKVIDLPILNADTIYQN